MWSRVRWEHQEIQGSAQVTFTGAIRAPQDSAFLYVAERLEQASDVLLTLLLAQHSHKQLSVLWGQIQESLGNPKSSWTPPPQSNRRHLGRYLITVLRNEEVLLTWGYKPGFF